MRPYTRIRKRFLVVTVIMICLVLLLTTLVLLAGTRLSGRSDRTRFSIRESSQTAVQLGGGISLSEPESPNLLLDASFEPLIFRQSLTIYSGDESTLTISSEEAGQRLYPDGFFTDATARVLSQTDNGIMLKKTARVSRYGINRVGVFQPVQISGDLSPGQSFLDFAGQGDLSVGVGERGLLVRTIASQSAEIIETGLTDDLTGVSANKQWFAACSQSGDFLFSENGRDWSFSSAGQVLPLRAVAISDESTVVAVGDRGSLAVGEPERMSVLRPFTQADLTDVASNQSIFVVVGKNNTIMTSQNGLVWRQVQTEHSDDWMAVDFRDGRFIVAGGSGVILASDDGISFQMISRMEEQSCRDVVILSRQQMIVLNEAGDFLISNDGGQNWQQSGIDTGMTSRVIALAGKDTILSADQTGQIGLAQLVAEITLDSPLREGQFHSGDVIFLEKSSLSVPEGFLDDPGRASEHSPWIFYGSGDSYRTDAEFAPHAGQASLLLQSDGDSDQPAIISQKLDLNQLEDFRPNEVLQLSVWMKQDGVADRSTDIWLSGPFGQIGTTVANVGSTWKKYTYAFVVPDRPGGYAGQDVSFSIAVKSGKLWIDRVFLGRLNESPDLLPVCLQEQVTAIEPQMIRMDFLGIGRRAVPADNWSMAMNNDVVTIEDQRWMTQRGSSIHAALSMAVQSHSDPWLVIDAYASETEMIHLIDYLTAPISEPYGRIRQGLGMTLPWTSQFQKIYFEFCDTEDVWLTDRNRADSVNRMIEAVSQSSYYQQLKNKVIFLDGMGYEDGVMLSKADYHVSDLNQGNNLGLVHDTEKIISRYWDQIPRNPDKPTAEFPELIRSTALSDNALRPLRLADVLDLVLFDLGRQSGAVNLDKPADNQDRVMKIWESAAVIVSRTAQGRPLDIQVMQNRDQDFAANQSAENEEASSEAAIRAYGFSESGFRCVVFINRSAKTQTCQMISELDFSRAIVEKYDADGNWLSSQILNRTSGSMTLLPGGAVVVVKQDSNN